MECISKNLHNEDRVIKARIERPLLPKDVLALRSAQSRTLDVSWCIFDENHNLIGKRVPFASNMYDIEEEEVSEPSGANPPAGIPQEAGSWILIW